MPLVIGVPREVAPGEARVSLVPDVAKKYQSLGVELLMEAGAGAASHQRDADYPVTVLADADPQGAPDHLGRARSGSGVGLS